MASEMDERKRPFRALQVLEAATGFEPVIKVLQTFALPLGHAARSRNIAIKGRLSAYPSSLERKTGLEPATLTLAR